MLDKLRMSEWSVIAIILLGVIAWVAPQQVPVVIYKAALVTLFAHIGYWIHRRGFLNGRDDDLSRAIIIGAVVLAGAMAL